MSQSKCRVGGLIRHFRKNEGAHWRALLRLEFGSISEVWESPPHRMFMFKTYETWGCRGGCLAGVPGSPKTPGGDASGCVTRPRKRQKCVLLQPDTVEPFY